MDILIIIGAKVAEYAIAPIVRQVGYLFFYEKNIKDLEQQLETLEAIRRDVQRRVNEATGNGDEIRVQVSTWLGDVDANKLPNNNIITQQTPSCFNFIQRHQLSRETNKRVKLILDLIHKGNAFDKVGDPAPLPDTKSFIPSDDYQILESRTLIAKQIKDALADPNVNKVGVYGMGGVGKTKLLDEVKKLVLEDKLFDRVIEVTIGQSNGEIEIQEQIGNKLHIELPKSKEGRASFLRNKLAKMEDNILVMLDDLWKEYDLIKEVGIPCRSKSSKEGCKILMTSRFRDKLINNMNVEKCFQVESLSEEESWNFFTTIIGDTFDMEHIAKKVVKKCGGLPIALKILAKALKGKDLRIWKDALNQLENPISVNIDGVSDQLYSLLKLSYNWIKSEAQLLFLLCSVFPDDHWINVEKLQMYTMVMRLLNDVNTWEEAKNRVIQLVDHLKSSSLLLEMPTHYYVMATNYVQMHDVVRDVAKYIASEEGKMNTLTYRTGQSEWQEKDRCQSYTAIFVNCNDNFLNLPQNLKTPKLELFILQFTWYKLQSLQNSDVFFEGMEELKVLDLSGAYFQPLWTKLKNLGMLCMTNCQFSDIDTIGELKKLEVLNISRCPITELPATMDELTQLKVLEVTRCSNLEVIPANILSSMTKLERLKLWKSFKRWGEEVWYKDKWIKNVKFSELNCLSHLTDLTLEIPKVDMLSDELILETWKLEEFHILVGNDNWNYTRYNKYATTLLLNTESQIVSTIDGVLERLLQGCENLQVNDSAGFTKDLLRLNGKCYPCLKRIHISENSNMKSLENIVLMDALTIPFEKLQIIKLSRCDKLRNLFSFSIFRALSALQEIEIDECGMMDGIVFVENKESTITVECNHLTSLKLHNLHQLTSFCTKQSIQESPESTIPFFDDQVSFPNLEHLSMRGVHNLEILWYNNGVTANCLGKLQTLELHNCNKLRYVFPSNMVKSLVLLSTLKISFCVLLERIFEIEVPTVKNNDDVKVVPLADLSLSYLPNLKYIWDKDPDGFVIFSSLNKVHVTDCPRLKSVFPASFMKYLQQIKSLKVHDLDEMFPEGTTSNSVLFPEIFPKLRSLRMGCMGKLVERSFWVRSELFLKLESLSLIGCEDDDMITLALEMSETLYRNDHNHGHGNLKRLDLCNFPKLKHIWRNNNQMTMSFYSLTELQVTECNGMMNLFSTSVAKLLVNLKSIEIYSCGGMISMVSAEGDGEEEEENGEIIFNKLTDLKFKNLPRMASFNSEKCTLKFPCLNNLVIEGCPEIMETFSYGTISMPILEFMRIGERQQRPDFRQVSCPLLKEDSSIPEENNLELLGQNCTNLKRLQLYGVSKFTHVWTDNTQMTTSFDSLEEFYVRRCENLKCLLPSSITFFNLTFVEVSNCHGMMNLFSSAATKNVVNLDAIEICDCGGMSSIVAAEAEGEEENDEIVFSRLTHLHITCLPSLISFHSGKCRLIFPYLSELKIKECPKMKTFSYGVISTPNLGFIELEGKKVGVSPTGGINITIQNSFTQLGTEGN